MYLVNVHHWLALLISRKLAKTGWTTYIITCIFSNSNVSHIYSSHLRQVSLLFSSFSVSWEKDGIRFICSFPLVGPEFKIPDMSNPTETAAFKKKKT